jgi:hypothetical protein
MSRATQISPLVRCVLYGPAQRCTDTFRFADSLSLRFGIAGGKTGTIDFKFEVAMTWFARFAVRVASGWIRRILSEASKSSTQRGLSQRKVIFCLPKENFARLQSTLFPGLDLQVPWKHMSVAHDEGAKMPPS